MTMTDRIADLRGQLQELKKKCGVLAKVQIFQFQPFSRKQKQVLTWWLPASPVKDYDGIIADGAIRSGKTVSMSLSFVMWAMQSFNGQNFIMAGKTVGSFRRNVLFLLKLMLRSRGYHVTDRRADNLVEISRGQITNYFYIFGGKDESSQDLVQGITAAGAFFDEVALMPESFVNQATGRCSVTGSKYWFNCNPGGPMHWFKINWIDKCEDKHLLYLHFTMDDNLSLSEEIKARYRGLYAGVFYLRYIKGLWAVAEGLIYTMLSDENLYDSLPPYIKHTASRVIAVDYGTTNPCVFLDTWDDGETIWFEREYRWDSRSEEAQRSGKPQKTDREYADDMVEFMGSRPEDQCMIIVDPSAASFIAELRSRGWVVKEADNEVLDGIRKVSTMLASGRMRINRNHCKGFLAEMQSYVWDDKAIERGEEKPVKQKDHGPDAARYRINALPKWRIGA